MGLEHKALPDSAQQAGYDIVGAAIDVHKALGPGLLESAYEACLAEELGRRGCRVDRQLALPVVYKNAVLDVSYRVDLMVSDCVIVEVKSVEALTPLHEAQLLTYLRLSGRRLGFLINFNVPLIKLGIRRKIL